jgi:triacylglycerol lipase
MAIKIPPGFDKAIALKLANASMLAYNQFDKRPLFTMPAGYTLVSEFTANVLGKMERFAYLMQSATDAVLAFRGTSDFPDAIADVRFVQAAFPFLSNAGLTHIGFTACYQSCRDAVIAAVKSLPAGITLYVTGHSLGGGVATLAALDVAANTPFSQPILYTIASPRVGDHDFANRSDATLISDPTRSWRVVNMLDLVPLLPPRDIIDVLDGKTYFYQHVTNSVLVTFVKGGAVANHNLQHYIEAIERLP